MYPRPKKRTMLSLFEEPASSDVDRLSELLRRRSGGAVGALDALTDAASKKLMSKKLTDEEVRRPEASRSGADWVITSLTSGDGRSDRYVLKSMTRAELRDTEALLEALRAVPSKAVQRSFLLPLAVVQARDKHWAVLPHLAQGMENPAVYDLKRPSPYGNTTTAHLSLSANDRRRMRRSWDAEGGGDLFALGAARWRLPPEAKKTLQRALDFCEATRLVDYSFLVAASAHSVHDAAAAAALPPSHTASMISVPPRCSRQVTIRFAIADSSTFEATLSKRAHQRVARTALHIARLTSRFAGNTLLAAKAYRSSMSATLAQVTTGEEDADAPACESRISSLEGARG